MKDFLLHKIMDRLALNFPVVFEYDELTNDPATIKPYIDHSIVEERFAQQRICPTCEIEILAVQGKIATRLFTRCTRIEEAARDYVAQEDLKILQFNFAEFLALLTNNLGIVYAPSIMLVEDLLWRLGNHGHMINGHYRYLFFLRDFSRLSECTAYLNQDTQEATIFYSGHVATNHLPNIQFIPISEVVRGVITEGIDIDSRGLFKHFPEKIVLEKSEDIILDRDIVLSKKENRLLIHRRPGGGFQKYVPIRPQTKRIIRYLYQIRNYSEREKSVRDMTNNESHKAVRERIRETMQLCNDEGVKQIFHQGISKRWGLNPELDCCKESIKKDTI